MGTENPARRGRLAKRERELSALANRQHGVVSRRQLLDAGLGSRTIRRRVEAGRLYPLFRGVYILGREGISARGEWQGAVLMGGDGALLSHRSAAELWGLTSQSPVAEITTPFRRRVPGIAFHEGGVHPEERTTVNGIPVTSVARTLLDLAEMVDEREFTSAWEEADRRRLLDPLAIEAACARGFGRRGLKLVRPQLDAVRPTTRSPLEARVVDLCRAHSLPIPETNAEVLGKEVDAFWPEQRLMVEADGYEFHGHRAAFESDRARDAEMQVAGYRVLRLTHRRLDEEPQKVAAQLRRLLTDVPVPGSTKRHRTTGTSERGQGTVEWVGLVALVVLTLAGLVAVGVRVPGAALANAIASRLLCAAALAEHCGDEPVLIAAYGDEVGRLVRERMPAILYERGSRAVPVDFRRCRRPRCGDAAEHGIVRRTEVGLPVTAFVHVIDCRVDAVEWAEVDGADCSGVRAGNLYIQYWLYYADSATLRGVPIAGAEGYHRDDWESAQFRVRPDGDIDARASSHNGYNDLPGPISGWASDVGVVSVKEVEEDAKLRSVNGWGRVPEAPMLFVSGGSHAGHTAGIEHVERLTPPGSVHLVPLEPVATTASAGFAITPPWHKRAWRDPEATDTH